MTDPLLLFTSEQRYRGVQCTRRGNAYASTGENVMIRIQAIRLESVLLSATH